MLFSTQPFVEINRLYIDGRSDAVLLGHVTHTSVNWLIVCSSVVVSCFVITTLIARFMGPIWGRQDPGGPHVGPII